MSSFAIHVQGLSKQYTLGELKLRDSISERLGSWYRRRRADALDGGVPKVVGPRQIWALKDVSFELASGEILGVIGRNGAGKSTLLKILSRITEPTHGRAEIRGRVGSLLEVGTGFHPDLTGRENVFMNGAILGMTQREVRTKFDQIVDFAGIGEFIDTPVKRYSSGMYTRLAFAVAAHLEPDILIVDEVLAVGDLSFQRKCLGKMSTVAGHGRTVIFVSHNMASISSLCRRALVLKNGRIAAIGDTAQAIQHYLADIVETSRVDLRERSDRSGAGGVRLVSFEVLGADGRPIDIVLSGQRVTFRVGIERQASGMADEATVDIAIFTATGQFMSLLSNGLTGDMLTLSQDVTDVFCQVDCFPFCGGLYALNLTVRRRDIVEDWVQQAVMLTVEDGDFFGTGRTVSSPQPGMMIGHEWTVAGS